MQNARGGKRGRVYPNFSFETTIDGLHFSDVGVTSTILCSAGGIISSQDIRGQDISKFDTDEGQGEHLSTNTRMWARKTKMKVLKDLLLHRRETEIRYLSSDHGLTVWRTIA